MNSPGQEGPSYAPPPLPEGWIAQWDGMSRKYYFVQLSTGASQWETPTHAAPTGPTPQATPQGGLEHPYGTPGQQAQQNLDIINNPDGSQSIRHPDGTVEPVTQDRDMTVCLICVKNRQWLTDRLRQLVVSTESSARRGQET
jgi:hypothetical protein